MAVGEFARHLRLDRGGAPVAARRAVFELGVRLDRCVDLRDARVLRLIGREDAPACWLDERISRAVGTFFRDAVQVQGLIVPSVAYLDEPHRFNLVCFLENLPASPRSFLPRARRRSTVSVVPAADEDLHSAGVG